MRCAHPTCTCTATCCQKGEKRYCSDDCAATDTASTSDCDCQHADCSARTGATTGARKVVTPS